MTIETYGNDSQFHKVVSVEVTAGALAGNLRVIIHQLVETDRDDYSFGGPANGRFIMKHSIDLFRVTGETIGQIIQE